MSKRRFKPLNVDVAALYESGLSLKDIALAAGISHSSVRRRLAFLGVREPKKPTRPALPKKEPKPEVVARTSPEVLEETELPMTAGKLPVEVERILAGRKCECRATTSVVLVGSNRLGNGEVWRFLRCASCSGLRAVRVSLEAARSDR